MSEAGPSSAQQDPAQMAQLSQPGTSQGQLTYIEEEQENILSDKDINVRDPILPIFDLCKTMQTVLENKA